MKEIVFVFYLFSSIYCLDFKVNSTNYLFEPVTVNLRNYNDSQNSTVVFLDYRPFTVIPKKESLWERIFQKNLTDEDTVELDCDLFIHKGVYKISLDGGNETTVGSLRCNLILVYIFRNCI